MERALLLSRYKVLGSDGSIYMEAQEVHHASSDADDI